MINLRAAEAADKVRIKELVRAGQINPTGLNWRRFIVAENDMGDVVGCGQIKPHRDGSFELASLAVAPAYQRQGIAGQIVRHLIDAHDGALYLMCRSSLGDFYTKLGFKRLTESQMPRYFRRVARLASLTEILRQEGESLLVMGL